MFLGKIPVYLSGISFKIDRKSEEKARVVVATVAIQPFTKALAEDFSPGMARRIFKTDGAKADDLLTATFSALHAPQRVRWFSAPGDMPVAMEFEHVEVGPAIAVRADKETPSLAASLSLTFAYPTAECLLRLAHGLNNQFWIEFAPEQEGLLDRDDVPDTPRVIKGRRSRPQSTEATH